MSKPKAHLNSSDLEVLGHFFTSKEDTKQIQQELILFKKQNNFDHQELFKAIKASEKRIIKEIATTLAGTVLPTQENHEIRLNKIEKHLNLTPN